MRKVIYLAFATFLIGCSSSESPVQKKADLIIYSGITMVRPLNVLVTEFEKKNNVNIELKQGATGYLYGTIQSERTGDIFFPGSDSYRLNDQTNGIFKDHVFVGYNRLAIVTQKGNPKHLSNDIQQLTNPKYSVVLSAPDSSAVGQTSKKALDKMGITHTVYDNVTYFTTDSHRIFTAIRKGDADIALNWYATTKWPETKDFMDAIVLPENVSKPKTLELNLLSFSQNPTLAKQFMKFASSKHGLEVFAEYGFLTPSELTKTIKNLHSAHAENKQVEAK